MLRHVVLFSWKDDTPMETIREMEQAFVDLPGKINLIEDFEWGTDVSVENSTHGFTHCFFVSFKTEKDRDAYVPHPEHQAFVDLIIPHLKDSLVIDYQTP